jgi:hypothetical protein
MQTDLEEEQGIANGLGFRVQGLGARDRQWFRVQGLGARDRQWFRV